jgi:PAS domain S-box-containing protein
MNAHFARHPARPGATPACLLAGACAVLASVPARALSDFLPHGVCYTWNPGLMWLHLTCDALIGLAYFSIPVALVYFKRKRTDLPFSWIFLLFGLFIVACGATHWMEVWTLWYPEYWLSGAIKAVTAAASVPTAIALAYLVPQALAIPSVAQLHGAKAQLEAEVLERKRAEEALREAHSGLEARVTERTAELAAANAELQRQREWLQVTLSSIGDAVIATGRDGEVLFMNEVARKVTACGAEVGEGTPLEEVLPLIDGDTGAPVPNPATRAIAEGRVVSVTDSTLLQARDGRRVPIDDSAAPIRDADGRVIGAVLIFRDVTERSQMQAQREALTRELQAANELLDTVFNEAPVGLGIWDRELRFARLNDALAEMNGLPKEVHFGRTVAEVLPQVDGQVMEAMRTVRDTGQPVINQEASGMTPAAPGRLRFWNVSYFPVRIANEVAGVGAVCEEVTDKKEAEAERAKLLAAEREARAEAESANRLKDQFLATVSHELRTPLNSMMGWLHLLDSGKLDAGAVRDAVARIKRNAQTQARLIEDLLDVSRIISGKLRLEVRRVDPLAIVENAIDTVRIAADAKRIAIDLDAQCPGVRIVGDPDRLQQVVWNLLSNAVKFTPAGGAVRVALAQSADQLQISVTDNGRGIEPELLPHVFERFRQGANGPARQQQGLGLGLSIVRHLVELHGGTVEAHSAGVEQGAAFVVRLPVPALAPDGEADASVRRAWPPAPRLDGARVLVVDDEPDAREMLEHTLAALGAEVVACGSVREALDACRAQPPHVVVSDISMPDEDGYHLVRALRGMAWAPGRQPRAVALTALARPEDRIRALSAGFQMYLAKPVQPDELAVVVASVLGRLHA